MAQVKGIHKKRQADRHLRDQLVQRLGVGMGACDHVVGQTELPCPPGLPERTAELAARILPPVVHVAGERESETYAHLVLMTFEPVLTERAHEVGEVRVRRVHQLAPADRVGIVFHVHGTAEMVSKRGTE